MPIQIRELIVTATVEDQHSKEASASPSEKASQPMLGSKEDLVQACVDEVLRVLKQQGRR